MTHVLDPKLKDYASKGQSGYIDAVNKHGTKTKAAKALGICKETLSRALRAVAANASLAGYAPGHFSSGVAPGFAMGKVTVQRGATGEVERTWERQSPEQANQLTMLHEFAATLGEGVKGLAPISTAPQHASNDLLSVYPWGDPHFGMMAWWQDAGADFDLDEAERLTMGAVDRLVASAPEGSVGLLLNLGDMFHADNQKNQSQSGHQLDVSGRWAQVQQVGLRAMIHCVRRMLEKHSTVIVKINRGNHDDHSAYALSLMLSLIL